MTEPAEYFFASRDAASIAAADHIAAALREQLRSSSSASLVVTGGRSPARCYARLASSVLDWSQVQILLSDERWVAPDSRDSNEKLVRETLLVSAAASATLLPVYAPEQTPADRCQALNQQIPGLALPFACTLLGMGEDGHIASLFPNTPLLDADEGVDTTQWYVPVATAASEYVRISLTLGALRRSVQIVLLFFGAGKRKVFEHAKQSSLQYPVSRLLSQQRAPVHVFWAA